MHEGPLAFARPLEHPPDYALEIPVGGSVHRVSIPKERAANRAWRRSLLLSAEGNQVRQDSLRLLCSRPCAGSCLFWINAFGWTYLQNRIDDEGRQRPITSGGVDVPFITWPCQDEVVTELIDAIDNGHDVAVDKSRDMGLSWLIVTVFCWYWLFRPGTNFMVMSRIEELVDNPGDPDSIYWKLDYLLRAMPGWMLTPFKRAYLRLVRLDAASTIIGKSTTKHTGRAGRRTACLIDEAAMIDELQAIWVSLGQTTNCRIANSTPCGPGFFSKLVRSPQVRTLRLPWWDHPLKGRGRYVAKDQETGEYRVRSPWYDAQVARAVDEMEVAQELDMDHTGAGRVFFDDRVLNRHLATSCTDPVYVGDLVYTGTRDREIALRRRLVDQFSFLDTSGRSPLSLWCDLEEDHDGNWRPPQDRTYCVGIDISHGRGKSNSVGWAIDLENDEQIAEWVDARTPPEEFARQMVAFGYWLGGSRGCAFLCWEANGPGDIFGDQVIRLAYPWVYFHIDEQRRRKKKSDRFGYHTNPERKRYVLGILKGAMARNECIPRSAPMLNEAREYVFFKTGSVGPGPMEAEPEGARVPHGDRVIGAAMAVYGTRYAHRCRPPERIALPGSIAFRRDRMKERQKRLGGSAA